MKHFALIGLPNTGKSTLFNRLTGLSQRVGNWPGLTVGLARAKLLLGGKMVELVDLPGVHDLSGYSDDEAVVREVLQTGDFDAALLVLNACQLDRQLPLAVQLIATGLPCRVIINMADEAKLLGIEIRPEVLAERLGVPVLLVSAKRGQGWPALLAELNRLAAEPLSPHHFDLDRVPDSGAAIAEAEAMLSDGWQLPTLLPARWSARLDNWLMHPWLGVPLFFVVMAALFNATYLIGTPLQEGLGELLDAFKEAALVPLFAALPQIVQSLLLDGVWQGVSTVLTFAPILFVFFTLLALVEDSGYLARAAFITDALMAKLGLDGRGFVMQLMGFGCNVPAVFGTRVMRERGQRLLSMLIIPFSLCSARLQVVVFFASVLFTPAQAPWVLTGLYLLSFAVAIGTAWLFKRRLGGCSEGFLLEIPPYRLPGLKHMLTRATIEVRAFLQLAFNFILIGCVLVWLLTHIPAGDGRTLADAFGQVMAPVLDPIGIPPQLAVALLFGFVAKEVLLGSMAVIYGVPEAGLGAALTAHLDWVSAMSFLIFALTYTPCLATVAAIRQESRSLRFTVLSVAWSTGLAWMLTLLFYQSARALT